MEFHSLKATAIAIAAAACLATAGSNAADKADKAAKGQTPAGTSAPAAVGPASGTAAPGAVPPGAPAPASTAVLSEADILGLVLAVDTNEIEAAKVAEKKKIGKEAMSYAKMLRKDHGKSADKVQKLGKTLGMAPAMPAVAVQLRAKGSAELAELSPKAGPDFERSYIDAMVKGHAEVLQMIDSQMIPNAKTDALKQLLTEKRASVAAHLEHGKRLQGARASAAVD